MAEKSLGQLKHEIAFAFCEQYDAGIVSDEHTSRAIDLALADTRSGVKFDQKICDAFDRLNAERAKSRA